MPNQESPGKPRERDRLQIDFTKNGLAELDRIRADLEVRSRGAVVRVALSALRWILQEKRRGRRIISETAQGDDRQQIVLLLADIEGKTASDAAQAVEVSQTQTTLDLEASEEEDSGMDPDRASEEDYPEASEASETLQEESADRADSGSDPSADPGSARGADVASEIDPGQQMRADDVIPPHPAQ